jgi:hypothetical protein
MFSGAGAAIGAGVFAWVAGDMGHSEFQTNAAGGTELVTVKNSGFETAGIISASAGAALLVGAIVMMVESRTGIDLHPAEAAGTTGGVTAAGATAAAKPRYWAGEF